LELCAVLAVLALVIAVALPVLADGRSRTGQLACLNNLRQIGRALLVWNAEHGYSLPWRTDVNLGGTYVAPGSQGSVIVMNLRDNPWFQFSLLSNDLPSARVLACPSDTARPASDFSVSPEGGLLSPNYRNRAISYFLSLDVSCESGRGFLAGDRNISETIPGGLGCSSQLRASGQIRLPVPAGFSWNEGLHGTMGNILFSDGRVQQLASGESLRSAFSYETDGGTFHLLLP
jgi:prepilin-type processing-associated H-X9-DG protein